MAGMIFINSNEYVMAKRVVAELKLVTDIEIDKDLPTDYFIPSFDGDRGAILERKTLLDLLHSAADKRLWKQLEMLNDTVHEPYLILEGNLNMIKKFSKWNPDSIASLIVSVPGSWKIPIIPSMSQYWTARILLALIRRYQIKKVKNAPSLRYKPRMKTKEENALFFLCGLPNIGPKRAKELLSFYRTAYEAILDVEHWDEVIGEKTRDKIVDILF